MTDQGMLHKIFEAKEKIDDLGVSPTMIHDLLFRMMFNEGEVSFKRFVEVSKVHQGILDEILSWMQSEHMIEVAKAGSFGRMSYSFRLTEEGEERAHGSFERSEYIGPIPVPVDEYIKAINLQTESNGKQKISPASLKQALDQLVLEDNFDRQIGPAVNSGTSLFLYGPPGNGKTTIAQIIGMLLAGTDPIRMPYAISIAGQIVQIHDPLVHVPVQMDVPDSTALRQFDQRWGLFRRPVVMVGGELAMESLDLRYDPASKTYEAPLQMKANGGMFLIDDFGRQQVSPRDLLNRWIVPLDSGIDFFRLRSGQTFEIPFRQLIVFSTNLDPKDLVDDAFLRRIQMKVEVTRPDEKMFYQIFIRTCKTYNIPFDKDSFVYLVDNWFRKPKRLMQAVHPRDIIRTVISICNYEGSAPHLSPNLIDEACKSYFVR